MWLGWAHGWWSAGIREGREEATTTAKAKHRLRRWLGSVWVREEIMVIAERWWGARVGYLRQWWRAWLYVWARIAVLW